MGELVDVIQGALALRREKEPFLLATVVRLRGSGYRRPGARLLVASSGLGAGSISGGCLERDVAKKGFWRTRELPAVVVTYDATVDEDLRSGFGLGCDGLVDVLIERVDEGDPCDPVEVLARCLANERPVAMATVFHSSRPGVRVGARVALDALGRSSSNVESSGLREELLGATRDALHGQRTTTWASADGRVEALVEHVAPPPHLFVFGSGPDAVPVVRLAKASGWNVTVCDRQARFVTQERFLGADRRLVLRPDAITREVDARARSLAVVLSHDYDYDCAVLGALLASRALYIGLLGPRRRAERIFADLERDGVPVPREARARVHAPVGLDIGAETPAEVALSIVAEAHAALAGAAGGHLRDRKGPIHAPVHRPRLRSA